MPAWVARRVREAARLGARAVIVPAASDAADVGRGRPCVRCRSLREALAAAAARHERSKNLLK